MNTPTVLPLDEFKAWLDCHRDATVSAVFHDVVAHYEATLVQHEPTMFWNDADPEKSHDSIFEIVDEAWGEGSAGFMDTMTIQQAVRLPNITVRVISDPEDPEYPSYEVITESTP